MKALRVVVFQKHANYRIPESYKNRMTYPLLPPSTLIGAIHNVCDWKELHNIKVSIAGNYETKSIEYKNLVTFLDSCMDDRGDLIKLSHPNCFDSSRHLVSHAIKSQGSYHSTETETKIYDRNSLEEYKFLRNERDRIKIEKKDSINNLSKKIKEIQSLQKTLNKKDEKYIIYKNKENELKKEKEKITLEYDKIIENLNFRYNCYKTISTTPTYFEVLNNVFTTIYIHSNDENELNEIYENIENLFYLGRSEDSIEILEKEFVKIILPTKEINSKKNIKHYIPINIISNDEILTTRSEKFNGYLGETFGTCYYIPTTYEKIDNKRIFKKVKVLLVENFVTSEENKNVYYDEKNNEIICFIE